MSYDKTNVINIGELIAEKIKFRYAEITELAVGSANMVVDAFYPTYVRHSLTQSNINHQLGKRCSAISPFIANELNVFKIPFEDIVKMLGYKKVDLKKILDTVKSKQIDLVLAGLGGTGMNFMHWAEELANYTNTVNIFKNILIFDEDEVDLTNIFRFPQILNAEYSNSSIKKINLINDSSILSMKISKHRYFITENTISKNITDENLSTIWKNYVVYGAPSIETRELFSKYDELKFVSATHGNDECQLYIKPMQDSNVQMESYGMINLSVFFMNQIKMTIEFFNLLASDTDLTKSQMIMEYSFSNEYNNKNIIKSGLNRTYNFPIIHNNTLDQEENLEPLPIETSEENDTETIS